MRYKINKILEQSILFNSKAIQTVSVIYLFTFIILFETSCNSEQKNNDEQLDSSKLKLKIFKDKNEDSIENYNKITNTDVIILEANSGLLLKTFQPLLRDTTYQLKIKPSDPDDLIKDINFPHQNISYLKINDSIFQFKINEIKPDSTIGILVNIKNKNGDYLIQVEEKGKLYKSIVTGVGGFEYYKIK